MIGYAGQISLGHAAFFGMGAYASAILTTRYAFPPLLALSAGLISAGLMAWGLARPILRLHGHCIFWPWQLSASGSLFTSSGRFQATTERAVPMD